jgi:hypothetical protein
MGSLHPYPHPDSQYGSGSGFRRAKMAYKNWKKVNKIIFEVLDILLRAKGFSCSLTSSVKA